MQSILKSCLKSVNNSKLKIFSKDVTCVALGMRACHLVDVTMLDLNQAKTLLFKLRQNSTDYESLVLLQFKDRFTFLCNKNRLKEHIQSTLNDGSSIFISVQDKEPVRKKISNQLIYWIENKISPFLSLSEQVFYSPVVPTCMVAFTGWALEYPVVYTTHESTDDPEAELDEWEVRSNCLGNRCLQVVQVWLSDHMLMSFSYPLSLIDNTERLESDLQLKMNQRLVSCDWLGSCQIKKQQVSLERFAI